MEDYSRTFVTKKIIMTVLLFISALCIFLPFVNVLRQERTFRGIDLLMNNEYTFQVVALGSGGQATLQSPSYILIIALITHILAAVVVWLDRRKSAKMQIISIILGVIMLLTMVLAFGLVQVDLDVIELKMGAGVYLSVLTLIIYLVYASCKISTPLVEVNLYIGLFLLGILLVYPYINTLALSFDSSGESISVLPKQFTLSNYKYVLLNPSFYNGLLVTVSRTLIGTIASLVCTIIFSYGLSKSHLIGQKIYMKICIITMYFSGGLIPVFIVFGKLGLVNNYWVYIIPNLLNIYNTILVVNYFKGISPSLEESAKIDGANDFQILGKIMVPIAAPIIAVIGLFNAVFQWNSWYDAYLYMIGRPDLKPLQNVLIDIVNESQIDKFLANLPISIKDQLTAAPVGKSIVAAAIILTIGPIILVYPLIQKYFVKGMMLGSVKE